jgi:long-chain acyl-CoA synthetase
MTEPEYGSPEHWARHRPDAPAVVHGDALMTYRDWNERADRVAEGLSRLGLGPGDRLGLRFRLGFPWFVIQRALQKLGVVSVAVNWRLTPSEAAYIIADSGAKGLACDDRDPGRWLAQGVGLLVTVGQAAGAPGVRYEDLVETSDPTARCGPARPAMVLYTSGTTGAPRGVPPLNPATVDGERLLRYLASVSAVPPTPDGAVVLLTLPVHHGAGAGLAAMTCAAGGTVVLLDPYDPEEALRLIERHRVQSWTGVPTMLLRIQALPDEVVDRYDLSSLTAVNTGAAPVPQSLKEWIVARLGEGMLWEGYGASEAGMVSFARPEHQLAKPGTSGLPYDGVEIAVVDEDWNRLPPGSVGEIAVNTPVVIPGYLGRVPFDQDTVRDGFYRTGDAGYLDEDGFLFITDRIKDMIVAGGVNIYPAEIEKVIVEHPDVVQAAVIGVPEPEFGEQPLAFIVARAGSGLTDEVLSAFLDARLAAYKRPRQYVFADELPLNPTGKVLKTELRAPYWEGRDRRV